VLEVGRQEIEFSRAGTGKVDGKDAVLYKSSETIDAKGKVNVRLLATLKDTLDVTT